MNNSQNMPASRYGAFELKSLYRRNMLLGTMISALLAIATTAGAFLFMQSEPMSTGIESKREIDTIIVYLERWESNIPKPPEIYTGGRSASGEGGKPIPVPGDELVSDTVIIASINDSYDISGIGDDMGEVGSYIDNPGYGYGGEGSGDYPDPDKPVYVDKMAEMIYEFKPDYPRLAKVAGMVASVWIKALVDIDGSVRDAMIFISSGSKAGFDEAALAAAYRNKYSPAKHNGRPVPIWVSYKVEFVLEESW